MVNDQIKTLSGKHILFIIWALLCFMPIVGMAVDLVSPSLPAIANNLQVSVSITKDIISIYLFGYALGNFITGFLTDALGRQKLIRIALLAFIIVSLIPVLFPNITILLLARFFQGITLGAVAVLARAIFSDILIPEKLIKLGPLIGSMWGLGPVVGPVIGGYLQFYFGWKAGFYFFALAALCGLIAIFLIVPETHYQPQPLNIKTIKNNLFEVLTNRLFMAIVILMGLVYSLIITFNTLGPFLIQTKLHYTPVFFGHLALWLGLIFLSATFICRYLLKKYKVEQLYFVVINFSFLIAVLAIIASYFFTKSIVLITIASALMYFTCGFIFPLSMGKGLALFRHIAGTASATMYLINILITSLTAFLVSFINLQNAIPLMWIYFLLTLMCVFVFWSMIRRE